MSQGFAVPSRNWLRLTIHPELQEIVSAFIESFNGPLRGECLKAQWFLSRDDARAKMEEWRNAYNTVRPYGAIDNKSPISLMKGLSATARLELHTPEVPARGDPTSKASIFPPD